MQLTALLGINLFLLNLLPFPALDGGRLLFVFIELLRGGRKIAPEREGLVHLVGRRYGITLPRDAYEQRSATEPVPLGSERPGDLYFFARPDRRAHHVGFVAAVPDPHTGERRMVHACGTHGAVRCEVVAGERADTLVAAHRFLH